MNKHRKICFKEREQILKLTSQGDSIRQIALKLGRHHSNISREIRRVGMNRSTYSLATAQVNRNQRASLKGRKPKLVKGKRLLAFVKEKIAEGWSPEQISGHLTRDKRLVQISHESIYRYIYSIEDPREREDWIRGLRQKKKRRSRKGKQEHRGKIPNRVSIHSRPESVNKREEGGHWEGDLVIGQSHASAIGTIVERCSRLTIIVPFEQKTSNEVVNGFSERFAEVPEHLRKSLTYDNGSEMAQHAAFTKKTGMQVYFADPGCPGQRGTNENTNGLIREYFPKGTNFKKVGKEELRRVERLLNQRPRKVLGFATPEEVFRVLKNKGPPLTPKHRSGTYKESSGDLALGSSLKKTPRSITH